MAVEAEDKTKARSCLVKHIIQIYYIYVFLIYHKCDAFMKIKQDNKNTLAFNYLIRICFN